MKRIQKCVRMSRSSADVKDTHLKPPVPGVGRIEGHPISFSPCQLDRPLAETRTVQDWIQEIPSRYPDINGGVIKESMSLALRYCDEVQSIAINHRGPVMELNVFELLNRLSLLADGESDLDQKLAEVPEVREQFVSDLIGLVLVLSKGLKFFRPDYQQSLVEDTHRLVEQASKLASCHLDRPTSCPPVNIFDFILTTKSPIKSRLDNLYDLLPTTQHLIDNFDETKEQQAGGAVFNNRKAFDKDMLNTKASQKIRKSHSRIPRPTGGTALGHRLHSNLSNVSKDQSSGSSRSRSISSAFSASVTNSSVDPLTDTVTSDSPSENDKSSSEPKDSNRTRASSSYSKCKTTSDDPAVLDGCIGHSKVPGTEQVGEIWPQQIVIVWHHDGQSYDTYCVLIDTGSDESFIVRSVVEEQQLDVIRTNSKTFRVLNGTVQVRERVQPKWRLYIGKRPQFKFPFHVLPQMPKGIDMILGNRTRLELGIRLQVDGNLLVVHADSEDSSTLQKQQQEGERQARDATASDAKWKQLVKAEHEKLIKAKAAADAANPVKRGRMSQKAATWSSGEQRQ